MINFLCEAIGNTWELPFEIPYIVWLQSLGGKGSFIYWVMQFFTLFGEELVLVALLGLVYWGLDKERGAKLGLFMSTALLLNPLIKNIAMRKRPFHSHGDPSDPMFVNNFKNVEGYSFPSGHSANSASVIFGTAVVYRDKKQKWLWAVCSVIPVLVAISRNYLGAHYPTDVIAGLALGVGAMFFMNWLLAISPNKYYVWGGLLIVGLAGFFYCTTEDFFTGYGITLGLMCGMMFEEKFTKFQNTKVWWRILLRVVVGGALFMGLNEGIKMLVGAFGHKVCLECGTAYSACINTAEHKATAWFTTPDHTWFERIFRVLRYGAVVFLMIGIYPMLFAQTEKLWRKWGWLKDTETTTTVAEAETDETPETVAAPIDEVEAPTAEPVVAPAEPPEAPVEE